MKNPNENVKRNKEKRINIHGKNAKNKEKHEKS